MFFKGGVARAALCAQLGIEVEIVRDIDDLPSLTDDYNVREALGYGPPTFEGALEAYMSTRDLSINEVLVDDEGNIWYSDDCLQDFMLSRITVREHTARAICRGARMAARFGFALDLGEIEFDLDLLEWDDEVLHQWTKAICEGSGTGYLSWMAQLGWTPGQEDLPFRWRETDLWFEMRATDKELEKWDDWFHFQDDLERR